MTSERFDLIVAIYCLCNDYHSGQWSRGYRILSRIETWGNPRNLPCTKEDLDEEWESALMIYEELEAKYSEVL